MQTKNRNENRFPGGFSGPPGGPKSWLRLFLGLAAVAFFIYFLAPWGEQLLGMRTMSDFIDERNLRATALYYTDIDEFGAATATLRNCFEYPHDSDSPFKNSSR